MNIGERPPSQSVATHLDELKEMGYCVLRGAVAPESVQACRSGFEAWTAANPAECAEQRARLGRLPRIVNLHDAVPPLGRLFSETQEVFDLLDAFFGAEAVLYTSLYYEQGSGQSYHRDAPYFATQPLLNQFLGVWFALEATDGTNGSLGVIAGGHKVRVDKVAIARQLFPDLDTVPPLDTPLWVAYQDAVVARCRELGLEEHELHVQPGDVILWDGMLPHCGTPIVDSSRTRHSIVMHTIPVGTTVHHADVYFNPDKKMPPAVWQYREISNGRREVDYSGQPPRFG
jgi:ectoine hydroxylase-related dioxygenase (phytanoyl-CoA dioxygenase family)